MIEEVLAPSDYEHIRPVLGAPVVLPNRPTADPLPDQVKDLGPAHVLAHTELRHKLPSHSRARIPLDRYVKAAFSIDESRNVRIQPFLLIGRTCRFFTALTVHGTRAYVSGVTAMTSQGRVAQDASGFSSI